jgi:tryptophan-rich hypothetical protein
MNRIHPDKLEGSAWTARHPRDAEKHFVVRSVHREGGRIARVRLEAVHSGRVFEIGWRELRDDAGGWTGWR